MEKNSLKFNLYCLVFSGFFIFGIIWLWRGEIGRIKTEKKLKAQDNIEINNKIEVANEVKESFKNKDKKETEFEKDKVEIGSNLMVNNEELKSSDLENNDESVNPLTIKPLNLFVPFTSQAPEKNWDEPWQDACEEAAVLMLDSYYKNYNLSPIFAKDEIIKMVDWEKGQGWGNSISVDKIKILAEHFIGKNIKIIENPTVEQIKNFIKNNQPVLAVADGKVLPNPNFRNGGPVYHALIIKGFNDEEFITNDPGTQFGKNFKYRYDDLLDAIHDWNNGDVKSGQRVVLVVE